MSRVNVSPEDKQDVSHVFTLTNVATDESVALIPSDSAGNFSWSGITKAPIVRNAMQTSQTSGEWSDLEYPYMAMPQEDWTGGRANLRFTIDKSRYYDSRRAQSAFNQCIYNAPLDYYSNIPEKKAYTNYPASLKWIKVQGTTSHILREINVSSFSCGHVYIHLRRRGKPTAGLTVRLQSAKTEGTIYAEHTYTVSEITDITAEFAKFSFDPVTLNGNVYLEVFCDGADNNNYWEIGFTAESARQTYRSNGTTAWDLYNYDLLYRLDGYVANPYKVKFFMYEQIMCAVLNRNNGAKVIMNGGIGRCVTATNTTLTSAAGAFPVDFTGAKIRIVYGQGSHVVESAQRTILSNTDSTVTVDKPWDIIPADGSIFVITDTPQWTDLMTFQNPVTDVHVVRGIIYFCFGDYLPVIKYRYHQPTGTWQNKTLSGVTATFIQSVRDTNGMMFYRARNDGINHMRTVERSRLLDWYGPISWDTITEAITTADTRTKTITNSKTTTESQPEESTVKTTVTTTTETDSETPDDSKVTVVTEKEGVVDGVPVTSTVTTVTTKTTEEPETTTEEGTGEGTGTGEETGTTTTDVKVEITEVTKREREVEDPISTSIANTVTTKLNGQTISTETVSTDVDITEQIVNGVRKTITSENVTNTITNAPEPPIRVSCVTNTINFTSPDFDAVQYVITIGNFESDNYTGKCAITLQESEDGLAFTDVQTVAAIGTGTWRIFAHCQYPYRRFILTAVGTNCTVNNISISTSDTPHFEDPVFLLDNYGKITRLFEYGAEQEKSLWIFQEGMVSSINKTDGTVNTYAHDRINLDELSVTTEEGNGAAVATSDVYLLWSWLNGLQRYYNTQLEGKGPDHDEGMPQNMRGRITQIVSYPGSFFVSIDGVDGYSSVMMYNGSGWHNLYRAPNADERIYDIAFQPIYGDRPDRLWIQVGDNIIWLAMPSKILYALQDPYAEYTHESVLTSAWFTGGMAEVDKLWQSISIMADYLDGKTCWIEADYQLDDEEEWHPIPTNPFRKSPQQEEKFAASNESVNGKKMRYRLRMETSDIYKTPKVNVVLIKAIGRVDIKYSYGFHFRNIKYKANLDGGYQEIEPYELDELLNRWANELATLRLNSYYKLYDNKTVFLDGMTTNVVYEKGEGYLSQITMTEI